MPVIPIRARTLDELLERIAAHLVVLLNESEDPAGDMDLVLSMLDQRELWSGSMEAEAIDHGSSRFHAFARQVIARNPLLSEAMSSSEREFEPLVCDTVEDLMSNVVPYAG